MGSSAAGRSSVTDGGIPCRKNQKTEPSLATLDQLGKVQKQLPWHPRPFLSTAQSLKHGNRGSGDACQPRVTSGGRVAIRSATRPGDRNDPSLPDQLPCQRQNANQSTAHNRTRTQRSGARNRNRWGSGRATRSISRHHRASGGGITFQGRDGFDYEHEHRRKRLSTSTIESAWVDERNVRHHGGRRVDHPLGKTPQAVLPCMSLSLFCLSWNDRDVSDLG